MAKMKECPVCGTRVKLENLETHLKKVHPNVKVDAHLTEEDKTEIKVAKKKEKKAAKPFEDRERRRWAIAGIIVIIIVCAFILLFALGPSINDPCNLKDNQAPRFRYNDVDNVLYDLDARIGPRLILVEFFATTCSHCQDMHFELEELHAHYGYGDQLEIVSVSADVDDSLEDVRGFRDISGANWTFIKAPSSLASEYCVSATPTMFLIDYDGNIKEIIIGFKNADAMKNIIDDYL